MTPAVAGLSVTEVLHDRGYAGLVLPVLGLLARRSVQEESSCRAIPALARGV